MSSVPPQTIDFTLSTPRSRGEALRLVVGFCVAFAFLVAMPDAPSRVVGFGAAVAVFGAWMFDRVFRMQRHLRFGADGIHIRSKSDALRFVPWEHVVGLSRGPSRQLYLMTQYEELLIGTDFGVSEEPMGPVVEQRPLWAPGLKPDARMADLIESARAHCGPADSRCEAVLDGKERADWARVLKEALTKGDYRGRSLTRTDLLHDLANPSLSPELRACIASVVRPRFDEAELLRETLSATAAPRVRVALEEALAEAPAEAPAEEEVLEVAREESPLDESESGRSRGSRI